MKWNVGTKIGAGYGFALAIFVIVGAMAYRNLTLMTEASQWRKHTYEVLAELAALPPLVKDLQNSPRGFVLTGDESYLDPYRAALPEIDRRLRHLRELTKDNARQQQRLDRLEPLFKSRIAIAEETIGARRAKGLEGGSEIVKSGRGRMLSEDVSQLIDEMVAEETDLLNERTQRSEQDTANTKLTIILGTLAALLIAGLASLIITRNIAGPLGELTAVADRITVGDLSAKVNTQMRDDEVGNLARAFSAMTQSLRGMAEAAEQISLGNLRYSVKPQSPEDVLGTAFARMIENLRQQIAGMVESASVLGSAASEIVASTAQLASTASESAAAVSETTTTVEEIRQTAQMASQKSKAVAETALRAVQTSTAGRKSIDDLTAGMGRIDQQMQAIADSMMRLNEQNQTIGQIIATVEDLSAQSNLLAVNAAIEAAKAGEHGKGFSVVAQEVKSMAEQSRHATDRVRSILGEIQKATTSAVMVTEQGSKAVEAGNTHTGSAGDSIQLLTGSISEAAQAATQIAASSQQQLVGMDQVAVAMDSIKQASSQNVASAKQLETAARNLSDLGQRLKQMVDRYAL